MPLAPPPTSSADSGASNPMPPPLPPLPMLLPTMPSSKSRLGYSEGGGGGSGSSAAAGGGIGWVAAAVPAGEAMPVAGEAGPAAVAGTQEAMGTADAEPAIGVAMAIGGAAVNVEATTPTATAEALPVGAAITWRVCILNIKVSWLLSSLSLIRSYFSRFLMT